jgi:hypothetical protein
MILKPGRGMQLPGGTTFSGGLGWEGGDLDLSFLRRRGDVYEVVAWFNKDWECPELGEYTDPATEVRTVAIATPERDLVLGPDDRTGAASKGGYDEKFDLDPSKALADVDEYIAFGTVYDENDEGLTLGVAEDIVCGVKDNTSGRELQTEVATQFGFDVTARLVRLSKGPNGLWTMTNDPEGYGDADIFTVFQTKFNVTFPKHWLN